MARLGDIEYIRTIGFSSTMQTQKHE